MSASFLSDPTPYASFHNTAVVSTDRSIPLPMPADKAGWLQGIARRWHRERRRRKVGRAYDMALEIARLIPRNSSVLDVGCGSGYIAHHLSALLGTDVLGIDLGATTEAPIYYRQFDGRHFPVGEQTFDGILLCYVLHHSQDLRPVLSELHRVLRNGGLAIVYEDIPAHWWDRLICRIHDQKWRNRTGPCRFLLDREWRSLFNAAGFDIVRERALSRWRNLAHPVCRRVFVLGRNEGSDAHLAEAMKA